MSGTPVPQNDCFRTAIKKGVVVLWPMGNDVGPIRVNINKDEVILSCIGAEVSSYFLERMTWFGFKGDWLMGIRW